MNSLETDAQYTDLPCGDKGHSEVILNNVETWQKIPP